MPAYFNLILDTTPPQDVAVEIEGGAAVINDVNVSVAVTTSDADTTGYQVKLWGDIEGVETEEDAVWQMLTPSIAVTLTAVDSLKIVRARLRDDVWNESAAAADTTELDTAGPFIAVITGPDADKVSRIDGKRVSAFTWIASEPFEHYEVRVVPANDSAHTAGVLVGTVGSINVQDDGLFEPDTPIDTTIDGRDLPDPDGNKIVKVFARDVNGFWSV